MKEVPGAGYTESHKSQRCLMLRTYWEGSWGDLERSWGQADQWSQTIFFLWPQFVDDGEKANVMVMMITLCSPSCTGG